MTKLRLAIIASMVVGISACNDKENATPASITGTVADGYLVGATVCLDVNKNGDCDDGEPSATTGVGGVYTLSGVSAADIVAYPIVAKISADTIDEDTDAAVGTAYVMSAPANSGGFVSPMTTMVHSKLQSNPALSLSEAEDTVIEDLGFDPAISSVSLFEDYIAASKDDLDENAESYKRIHNVARVTASVIASNYKAVTASASSENVESDELIQLIASKVLEQLSSIAVDVEAATKDGGSLDSEELGSISDAVNNVDVNTLLQQVAAIQLVDDTSTESNLLTWIEGGFNFISAESEYQFFSYGVINKDTDKNRTTTVSYLYKNNGWVLNTDDENRVEDEYVKLTNTGWLNVPGSDSLDFSVQVDGSLRLSDPITNYSDFSLKSVSTNDIAGGKLSQFLLTSGDEGMSGFGVDVSAVFSTGAQAFLISVEDAGKWEIAYSACSNNQAAYTLANGTNCSVAQSQDSPLEQLNGVIGVSHNIGDNATVNIAGSDTDTSGLATITVLKSDNSVNIEANSTWVRSTINTEDLIIIEIPMSVREYTWAGENGSKAFFSKFDGYVRLGWYESPKIESEWAFNDVALDDLLANFSVNNTNVFVPEPLTPSGSGITACAISDTKGLVSSEETFGEPESPQSFSTFENAVASCSTSTALVMTNSSIEGNSYRFSDADDNTISFAEGGGYTVVSGEETFTGTWSIDDSDYLILLEDVGEDGVQERASMKIVESANVGEELSLKYYGEVSRWSDMDRSSGSDGKIGSFVILKIADSVNSAPLIACASGDTESDESDGIDNSPLISPKSFLEFEDIAANCATSTALAVTTGLIENNSYRIGDADDNTISFAEGGDYTVVSGEETFTGTWSIDGSDYLVLLDNVGDDGVQERTSIKIVESTNFGEELSLKLYTEVSAWSDMDRSSGSDGKIGSFVMSKI